MQSRTFYPKFTAHIGKHETKKRRLLHDNLLFQFHTMYNSKVVSTLFLLFIRLYLSFKYIKTHRQYPSNNTWKLITCSISVLSERKAKSGRSNRIFLKSILSMKGQNSKFNPEPQRSIGQNLARSDIDRIINIFYLHLICVPDCTGSPRVG